MWKECIQHESHQCVTEIHEFAVIGRLIPLREDPTRVPDWTDTYGLIPLREDPTRVPDWTDTSLP
jgi:hypothetical protein